jgi:predicted nucleic acid-binding protein
MSEVVLDANVIVAILDEADALHARARGRIEGLDRDGVHVLLLDFLLAEAVSVLCRRAFERKRRPPELAPVFAWLREQLRRGFVEFAVLGGDAFAEVLDVVEASRGELNFNDARLVVMQRSGEVGEVVTFDEDFARVEGFRLYP